MERVYCFDTSIPKCREQFLDGYRVFAIGTEVAFQKGCAREIQKHGGDKTSSGIFREIDGIYMKMSRPEWGGTHENLQIGGYFTCKHKPFNPVYLLF